MFHANNKKRETTLNRRNGTPKSRKNQNPRRKEILEANTIKQVDMKEKKKKNIPGEGENYLKRNYIAGTS